MVVNRKTNEPIPDTILHGLHCVDWISNKGGNIKEAIAWRAKHAKETGNKIYVKRFGYATSMAYIELFMKLFPEHPVAVGEQAMRKDRTLYTVHIGGGAATCFYRELKSA